MATVEKISIALTEDLAALVRKAVESGDYASTSEVIRDALRDWKVKRAARDEQAAELRRLWQEGIDSGVAGPLDIDAIKREARTLVEKAGR
ncbi:type II toxin-antitoxin system ParD family antitoxin [Methylolobus aquaticus]